MPDYPVVEKYLPGNGQDAVGKGTFQLYANQDIIFL
jgi:hypothetical protein